MLSERPALQLSDKQQPVLLAPEYWGLPGQSSVRYEADLMPSKPTTDVILNGHAYAPDGRPARLVPVELCIGAMHKRLLVHGDRIYLSSVLGRKLSTAVPFVRKPILYEETFGGTQMDPDPHQRRYDARNPVGRGFGLSSKLQADQLGPSVEYPDGRDRAERPAGFGAIAANWSPRVEFAGTYDARWAATRQPLLPDDFDERFWLAAPLDQQPSHYLQGGEPVALTNLTRAGTLRFVLPRVSLRFTTFFGRRPQEHAGRLASVILEPDEEHIMLVWQTQLRVSSQEIDYLDQTLVEEVS
jgi:hypothetical protein